MGERRRKAQGRSLGAVMAMLLVATGLAACKPGSPSGTPLPLELSRPRILGAGANPADVAAKLTREPYRTIFLRLDNSAKSWNGVGIDDHSIEAERIKTRAAKDLAFEYAINRAVIAGAPAPFATPADRQAAGDAARTLLLHMYTRSRLAVPAPLGGTDRDINTSEELLQYATAYDSLVGAGYPLGADDATIRTRITDLASELYDDYLNPAHASYYTAVLPNNHRSKSAAALGVAALALLESSPPQGAPPADIRSPAAWLNFAIDQVDLVEGWTFVSSDGAYGEGPYYQRYAAQNLLPFARAWDRAVHGQAWDVGGRYVRNLWTSPLYRQTQRWLLDTSLPNGALAPIDDGNIDYSYYFGAAPTDPADAAAFAWRWANAPVPYDTDGSVDLAADSIIAYDDSVVPAPPAGSPTRFYAEGGDAVFRSGWDADATTAVVLGEHGAAMELGRDRDGLGKLASAAHEQPDTGSFTIGAFGERLLLDPGYLTYETRSQVGKATDHNLIMVNGQGPGDPFPASVFWAPLSGPPNVDGQATISRTLDTPFLDTARVTSTYASTKVERRFFFVDDRYIIAADTLQAAAGQTPTFTWQLHGNGGGTSGGTFAATPSGGEWVHGAGRVDTAVATDAGPVSFATRTTNHEETGRIELTHTALDTSSTATGPTTHGLVVAYPSRSTQTAPTVETLPPSSAGTRIRITDPAGNRVVVATLSPAGALTIEDTHTDGTTRVSYSDGSSTVGTAPGPVTTVPASGQLGMRVNATSADLLAGGSTSPITVTGLRFMPERADGACSVAPSATGAIVEPGGDGAVTLRAGSGNSAPAADAGGDRNVSVSTRVAISGHGCDVDHDSLTPHWELVGAPQGSLWILTDEDTWNPQLSIDRPGPYRVRLTVSDGHGGTSRSSDAEIFGGPRCTGDRLSWNDPQCP